ncbi:hypothetical protein [Glutamicibacter creatinolyticus]|uniref:hypothetical protein n=1 Tax=Glutamicibacter creatinolyticus TaxID=162496 RepID=UPI003216D590
MADYQREFQIYGPTPIAGHLEIALRDTFKELHSGLGPTASRELHLLTGKISDIAASFHAAIHELESRINRLEDEHRQP